MRWIVYNLLFLLGFLVLLPRHLWRMWRRGGYRRGFLQRFARYDPSIRAALAEGGRIWIHAVSVGELYVALDFMQAIRRRRPEAFFLVSVTTSTAHRIARERLREERDVLVYFPVDLSCIQRRVLRRVRPAALLLVEGEIWPNLIRAANAQGVFVGIVNGRLSRSSYRGYRMLGVFSRPVLRGLDVACMQSEGDRARLVRLGADPARVHVCGSAKFDGALTDADAVGEARDLLRAAGFPDDTIFLLGGSTWPGEETALLDLYLRLKPEAPGLKIGLAPRHIERMPDVELEVGKRGLAAVRRTNLPPIPPAASPDVFLLDTTGELRRFYAGADLVFIGKSLTAEGGQNPIEAAAWGKPILCGPNMGNFPVVMDDFRQAEAIVQVADAEELESAVRLLLADPDRRAGLGNRAGERVRSRMGAIERTLDHVPVLNAGNAACR